MDLVDTLLGPYQRLPFQPTMSASNDSNENDVHQQPDSINNSSSSTSIYITREHNNANRMRMASWTINSLYLSLMSKMNGSFHHSGQLPQFQFDLCMGETNYPVYYATMYLDSAQAMIINMVCDPHVIAVQRSWQIIPSHQRSNITNLEEYINDLMNQPAT